MRFISDIGRPWTLTEMNRAIAMYHRGDLVSEIAWLFKRSVKEVRVILP